MSFPWEVLSSEVEDLRREANEEIDLERRNQQLIDKHSKRARRLWPVLAAIIMVNIYLASTISYYGITWIVASFFVYMYYFLVIMIPTTIRPRSPSDPQDERKIKPEPLRLARAKDVARRGKRVVVIAFWNSFFIGAQALARGIGVLLAVSMVFALLSGYVFSRMEGSAVLIVLAQGAAIIGYYLVIIRYRPYSKVFLDNLSKLRRERNRELQTYLKSALVVLSIVTVLALLLVTSTFLPGRSLEAILAAVDPDFEIVLIEVLVVSVSQFVIVRFIQGFDSAAYATRFIADKIAFLRNDILGELEKLPALKEEDRGSRLRATRRRFLVSRVYKLAYKDFFGHLPSYPLIVDFRAVLEEDVIEAFEEDIPLDITT